MDRLNLSQFADRHESSSPHLVGLISDTHGLIRPEALDALRESDIIIHCGDIGSPAVLEALRGIAPVRAIRGNIDKGEWAAGLPTSDVVELGSHSIYVLHNLTELTSIRRLPVLAPSSLAIRTNPLSRNEVKSSSSTPAAPVRGDSVCQ